MAAIAMAGALVVSCEKSSDSKRGFAGSRQEAAAAAAQAMSDLARSKLAACQPGDALFHASLALTADPFSVSARSVARQALLSGPWHLPEWRISLGMRIDHVWTSGDSVWAALSNEESSTAVRLDRTNGKVSAVLFPTPGKAIRGWRFSPDGKRVVIERNGVLLLCDATTLKPLHDLGSLPTSAIAATSIAFSPDSLWFAHPSAIGDKAWTWRLRDSSTGEEIRHVDDSAHASPALAAGIDNARLLVIREDASTTVVPISPIEEARTLPPGEAIVLREAVFDPNLGAFVTQGQEGPYATLGTRILPSLEGAHPAGDSDPKRLMELQPWTRHPSIWSAAHRGAERIQDGSVRPVLGWCHLATAAGIQVSAMAFSPPHGITGTDEGVLTVHQLLPPPAALPNPSHAAPDHPAAAALASLAGFLTGISADPVDLPRHMTVERRMEALASCNENNLRRILPEIDISPWKKAVAGHRFNDAVTEAVALLQQRLERAGESPPQEELEEIFANADDAEVTAAINKAGTSGPAAARCLELALSSPRPDWIAACLAAAPQIPPLLGRVATSRIAWLEGRTADAISNWPDPFPDYDRIRQTEDWDGWEAADFRVAFESTRLAVSEELAKLCLPQNATQEDRDKVYAHLTHETTLASVGRRRFASACLDAALAFATIPQESSRTFELAKIARAMGASPAPCLRAEALSLTALGDYPHARDRWIDLITNHPVADHLPGDYAEAAYTSFENQDSRQAMAILATGIHRFPNDAGFALRAGWVALLTAHPDAAFRFLLAGQRIGYPEEKTENAFALLAIAAFQSGAPEDAAAFYQELLRIDPAWRKPETVDSLGWPDELKSVLHHLVETSGITPDR